MRPTTMYVECTKEADVNQQCTVVYCQVTPISSFFFFFLSLVSFSFGRLTIFPFVTTVQVH